MKIDRIKSNRSPQSLPDAARSQGSGFSSSLAFTETSRPGLRRRAGTSRPYPARCGPAAAWTARNSCRRGWGPARACGSSARSAAESKADTAPRSTRSRWEGSGSAAAYGTGTMQREENNIGVRVTSSERTAAWSAEPWRSAIRDAANATHDHSTDIRSSSSKPVLPRCTLHTSPSSGTDSKIWNGCHTNETCKMCRLGLQEQEPVI